jgi:hypothetical protein
MIQVREYTNGRNQSRRNETGRQGGWNRKNTPKRKKKGEINPKGQKRGMGDKNITTKVL